jgi:hypothetical protein
MADARLYGNLTNTFASYVKTPAGAKLSDCLESLINYPESQLSWTWRPYMHHEIVETQADNFQLAYIEAPFLKSDGEETLPDGRLKDDYWMVTVTATELCNESTTLFDWHSWKVYDNSGKVEYMGHGNIFHD